MIRRLPWFLLIPAVAEAQPAPVAQGFDVERYLVALRPDLATTAVSATETIVLRATDDRLKRITFSPNALEVGGAMLDGHPVGVTSGPAGIVFNLSQSLRRGQRATLRFRLRGTPRRGVTAIPRGLYTSYFACDWMVCLQDASGDKAHLTLDLLLPTGTTSLSVGRAMRVVRVSPTIERHRWRSTRPYSAYLFAFAAGQFKRTSTQTAIGDLVYLDATEDKPDLATSFAQAPEIAAFLADKAGMALPDRRYTQLLVPGREAQEAAGFALIGQGEVAREQDDPTAAWIVTHEMAHQYWGNLVTCATWRDFWLNEGIATFMVAVWKERRFGTAAYRAELDGATRRLAAARMAGFDKPLAWDGAYPSLGVRRAVQYYKGALFLARLRETTGDARFWAGLRRYTRRHAGGVVTSRDFQAAMQQESSEDLAPLFDAWVHGDTSATAAGG